MAVFTLVNVIEARALGATQINVAGFNNLDAHASPFFDVPVPKV